MVLASARPPRSVAQIARGLGLPSLVVSLGGAFVLRGDEEFLRHDMDVGAAREVIRLARARGVHPHLYSGWEWLVESDHALGRAEAEIVGFEPTVVPDLEERAQGVQKFLVMGEPAAIEGYLGELAELGLPLDLSRSRPIYAEVSPRGVTKAEAIGEVAAASGFALADTVAFGDGENDAGMVAAAGVGVAMGNAMEAVKEVADLVVASNDEHGIAEGLFRLGLLARPWRE